jgi:predicted DCC family thiol-disulfide oxidoreductase YuxK
MSNNKTYTVQHLVLFDGVCNLCNRTVQFIIKNDPEARFKFAALQNYREYSILQTDQPVNNQTESVVYIQNGQVYFASSAVLEIFKELGWPWKILYAFKIFPLRFRDFFYNQLAKRRYRIFGKRNNCMIPSADIRDRFL